MTNKFDSRHARLLQFLVLFFCNTFSLLKHSGCKEPHIFTKNGNSHTRPQHVLSCSSKFMLCCLIANRRKRRSEEKKYCGNNNECKCTELSCQSEKTRTSSRRTCFRQIDIISISVAGFNDSRHLLLHTFENWLRQLLGAQPTHDWFTPSVSFTGLPAYTSLKYAIRWLMEAVGY